MLIEYTTGHLAPQETQLEISGKEKIRAGHTEVSVEHTLSSQKSSLAPYPGFQVFT